jgi:hypothetical protein
VRHNSTAIGRQLVAECEVGAFCVFVVMAVGGGGRWERGGAPKWACTATSHVQAGPEAPDQVLLQ